MATSSSASGTGGAPPPDGAADGTLHAREIRWDEKGALYGRKLPAPEASVVVVGAGFSRAMRHDAPLWKQLLLELRGEFPALESALEDPLLEAERIARIEARRNPLPGSRDARSNEFQRAIARILEKRWHARAQDSEVAQRLPSLRMAFKAFLTAVRAQVIIDLNYDPAVELALEAAGVPYIRAITSEANDAAIAPASALLVWKLHGCIGQPSTIVLSPSQYRFQYETNALGAQLAALGDLIGTRPENGGSAAVWSVGVGLREDEVWSYLCSSRASFDVVGLLLTNEPSWQAEIRTWDALVGARGLDATLLHGCIPGPGAPYADLAEVLAELAAAVESGRSTPAPAPNGFRPEFVDAAAAFDRKWRELPTDRSGIPALSALVERHRTAYDALREHLLRVLPKGGFAPEWCARIRPDDRDRDRLAGRLPEYVESFCAISEAAAHACLNVEPDRQEGLLFAAAAQSVIVYVVELAELLGIEVTVELTPPREPTRIGAGTWMLVGANPFERLTDSVDPLHFVRISTTLAIAPPVAPGNEIPRAAQQAPVRARGRLADLLTEEEWEAEVVHLWSKSKPTLRFRSPHAGADGNGPGLDVSRVPPLYPWGFRLHDIRSFRERGNTISTMWQLVGTTLDRGTQIVKGGGLRDRERHVFQIGSRGKLRIGEYDDFVQEALRYTAT